jgi:AraC-like DNA-binding protein
MLSLNLLIGAGSLQGLGLACVLFYFAHSRKYQLLRWLGSFVAAFSLIVLSDVLVQTKAILELPHLYQVFDFLIFWLGPFCYGYVRGLLGYASWRWPQCVLHFMPGLAVQALILPTLFVGTEAKRAVILTDISLTPQHSPDILILSAGLLAFAYLARCLFLMRNYWQDLENQYSNTERYKLNWLVQLLTYCSVLWGLWMLSIVWGFKWADLMAQLGLAIGVYALGYCGLRQPKLWSSPEGNCEVPRKSNLLGIPNTTITQFAPRVLPTKYLKSGISPEELTTIGDKLKELMVSELTFLEPELSLSDLADSLNISQHTLSQTLNMHFGQSFFEYINSLRVKEVQRCFADPAYAGMSILDIALTSGFSSKATFNATFKRLTGSTPSECRSKLSDQKPS